MQDKKAKLGYVSLELACHALETYKDRLRDQHEVEKLKVHCRRALLEYILFQKRPNLRHSCLKAMKRPHEPPFCDYALKVTEGLTDINLTKEELANDVTIMEKEGQWMRVVA